jgi:hypothetical protein
LRHDGPGSALNTLSPKWAESLKANRKRFEHTQDRLDFGQRKAIETTTLDQLIDTHGRPFFIKIDVEGFERKVLAGLKHKIPFLSFEVNLPEFKPEGLECVKLLERLDENGQFNYAVDPQRGLGLETWLNASRFSIVLDQCAENSIEVFWTTRNSSQE